MDIEAVKAPRATLIRPASPSATDFIARLMPTVREAAADHRHLADSYAAPPPDPAGLRDDKFAYGLDVVLDGLHDASAVERW